MCECLQECLCEAPRVFASRLRPHRSVYGEPSAVTQRNAPGFGHFSCFSSTAKVCQERCNTLAASSRWLRKQADPLAYKQVWYCPVCNARYRTTFGVLLQMISDGEERFVRATFPEHGLQQVKWSSVQRTYRQATTP